MPLKKRIFCLLLCISALFALSLPVCAENNLENDLILQYKYEDLPLAGAGFDLYLLAEPDGESERFVPAFSATGTGIEDMKENRNAAAAALWSYAQAKGIAPARTGSTDENGVLRFEALQPGLYLVVGHRCIVGDRVYTALPFTVSLPPAGGEFTALPKSEESEQPTEPLSLRVLKKWDDGQNTAARPESITVTLLCDGTVYDTRTLTAKDNWSCIWEGLDPDHEWCVGESVPEGYTYTVSRTENTFVITNTGSPELPAPTPTPTPQEPKLPQTGQLWWPVPVLTVLGLLCLFIGLLRRRGDGDA